MTKKRSEMTPEEKEKTNKLQHAYSKKWAEANADKIREYQRVRAKLKYVKRDQLSAEELEEVRAAAKEHHKTWYKALPKDVRQRMRKKKYDARTEQRKAAEREQKRLRWHALSPEEKKKRHTQRDKDKVRAYSKKRYHKMTPEERQARSLKTHWRMTVAEYEALIAAQGGVCKICKRPPKKQRLVLDHDHARPVHKKHAIRGGLCPRCNGVLIAALEDPLLENACAYLIAGGNKDTVLRLITVANAAIQKSKTST